MKKLTVLLPLLSIIYAKHCGWPGRPHAGQLVVKRQGFLLPPAPPPDSHPPGDQVEYSCPAPGHSLFGPRVRTCGDDGRWRPHLPLCGRNVVVGGLSSQSSTLWEYGANLALDANTDTCSWTNKDEQQRWWQVKLAQPATINSVKLNLKKENLQALTVFVVETLASNRTVYKVCGHYNNSAPREPRRLLVTDSLNTIHSTQAEEAEEDPTVVVQLPCEKDITGDSVMVRDDRKNAQYLTLCEIQVLAFHQSDVRGCGDPELPALSLALPTSDFKMEISCAPGHRLRGWDNENDDHHKDQGTTISCQGGQWNSTSLYCQEIVCPMLSAPRHGNLTLRTDASDRVAGASFTCSTGYIVWGSGALTCTNGEWSATPPTCRILNCGVPAKLLDTVVDLLNGTTTWGSRALYSCNLGFIMVVNASSDPIAQKHTSIMCTDEGRWSPPPNFACINAGDLTTSWAGSASLSINLIYCLVALLVTLLVPLALVHCWGRRLCADNKPGQDFFQNNSQGRINDLAVEHPDDSFRGAVLGSQVLQEPESSPTIGVYNVTSGSVIHPATVNPSTLRSFSTTHNTFKPPAPPLAFHSWSPTSTNPSNTIPSHLPGLAPAAGDESDDEPGIDESGYATLIIKREPFYEQVPPEQTTYDDVPRRYSVHEYMNTHTLCGVSEKDSASSYPDLLQMVTKTPSPVTRVRNTPDNTDVAQLYAKVDMEKKRNSRPCSLEEGTDSYTRGPCSLEEGMGKDSYTRTIINKFNSMGEEEIAKARLNH